MMVEQARNEIDRAYLYRRHVSQRTTEVAHIGDVDGQFVAKQYPRQLGTIAYCEGRKLSEFLVTLDNVAGAIGKVSTAFGVENVNLLSGYHDSEVNDRYAVWHFFADTTGKDTAKVANEIKQVQGVSEVVFSDGIIPELITSKMSFPVVMLGETRGIVFGLDTFSEMLRSLHSTFKSGAKVVLFAMGKADGVARAESLQGRFQLTDPKIAVTVALDLALSFGWGNTVLEEFNYDQKLAAIVIHDLFECVALKGSDHGPTGNFMRGELTGLLNVIMGAPMAVTETDCTTLGGQYCRFVARKSERL